MTHVFELLAALTALELIAGPRLSFVFHQRITDVLFGLLVLVGTVGAFVSPPFSGLDTLAALGVVVLSLAMLLKDALVAIVAMLLLAAGIVLEIGLGAAVIHGISSIL